MSQVYFVMIVWKGSCAPLWGSQLRWLRLQWHLLLKPDLDGLQRLSGVPAHNAKMVLQLPMHEGKDMFTENLPHRQVRAGRDVEYITTRATTADRMGLRSVTGISFLCLKHTDQQEIEHCVRWPLP